jgi:hypothetical protein
MKNQIKAVILDNETISIDGRTLTGIDQVAEALGSALDSDPDFMLVIEPMEHANYKGIGTVIYASQRVGVPVENLRYTLENGEVLTFAELQARNPPPSA